MVLTLPYEEGPAGLRPLKRIVAGLVIVYCALRVNDFDLLLNPLGWAMCATPLLLLRRSAGDPFDLARTSVLAMVCLSAVAVFAGWVGPSLGSTPSPVVELIGVAEGVGGLVAVWLITDAVIRRIRSYGIASGVAVLDVLRWVVVGLGALGTPAGLGYTALGPVVAVGWFACLAALLLMLYRSAKLPYAASVRKLGE
ncbi:hypothetical protein AB0K05_13180 [Nonomuraea sp. NPDC049486]|uniref:hypothetical protein n=1 Tax=Nonomuraea sp. NPDC049486 TaxID=3155773 RepID=UPI00343F30DE